MRAFLGQEKVGNPRRPGNLIQSHPMLEITPTLVIPENELSWSFARSSGPGGQNVNKVASKAVLRWDIAVNTSIPTEVKNRLAIQQKRYFTVDGGLIITSQLTRDQDRNRQDCLDKLRASLLQALVVPKARKKTRPTRGSKRRRVEEKRRRGAVKQARRRPGDD
jgi:ribosome-associated protein